VCAKRRDKVSLFLFAWAVAALAPVLLTRDISVPTEAMKLAFADRWAFHALAPSLLLWLRLAEGATPAAFRVVAPVATAGAVLLLLVGSGPTRGEFGSEFAMLGNEDRVYYLSAPRRFRTSEDRCRFKERKVARATLLRAEPQIPGFVEDALAICGERPELVLEELSSLVRLRRFAEAVPVARRLLAAPPPDPRSNAEVSHLAGVALVETGKYDEGEALLLKALKLGSTDCRVYVELAEAAHRREQAPEAAERLEAAFRCSGARDASLLIMAATWLVEAGRYHPAAELLTRAHGLALTSDQAAQAEDLRRTIASH
jgi:tetratricopeptide (TPR) repeat protein